MLKRKPLYLLTALLLTLLLVSRVLTPSPTPLPITEITILVGHPGSVGTSPEPTFGSVVVNSDPSGIKAIKNFYSANQDNPLFCSTCTVIDGNHPQGEQFCVDSGSASGHLYHWTVYGDYPFFTCSTFFVESWGLLPPTSEPAPPSFCSYGHLLSCPSLTAASTPPPLISP